MNLKKIALLAAMAFAASVFAQDSEEGISSTNEGYTSSYSSYSAPVATAVLSNNANGAKGIKVRFSGDLMVGLGWEFGNVWYKADKEPRENDKFNTFNSPYSWNAKLGLDFTDNFSMDFRLSNPGGYGENKLNFANGSAKDHIPHLPNAYFTWKPGSVFSLSGGLLNVPGNTVLDLVAGVESGEGLWTWYWGWDCEYNASQGGLKFGFDIAETFSLSLIAAMVSPTNDLHYRDQGYWDEWAGEWVSDYNHNEFRFILGADIGLGDLVTLTPTFQTRSFWGYYTIYEEEGRSDVVAKRKTPILVAYGIDAGFAFSDAFNLNAGLAMGNFSPSKSYKIDGNKYGIDESLFGFLMKVNPSINFGINEVDFNYSLGIGSYKRSTEWTDFKEYKTTVAYNDLHLGWYFRMNDNIAFGPSFSMAFASAKNDQYDDRLGYNYVTFGARFKAEF